MNSFSFCCINSPQSSLNDFDFHLFTTVYHIFCSTHCSKYQLNNNPEQLLKKQGPEDLH